MVEFFPGDRHGEGGFYGRTLGIDGCVAFEKDLIARDDRAFERMADKAYGRIPVTDGGDDEIGEHSQLLEILNCLHSDGNRFYSVNLPNAGQAVNLPPGAVLEATTLVNTGGFHPLIFGEMPPGIAAILQRVIGIHELTIKAALRGDHSLVVRDVLAGGNVHSPRRGPDRRAS